jgi:hypothetical protein
MKRDNGTILALGAAAAIVVAAEASRRKQSKQGSQALTIEQILAMAEKAKASTKRRTPIGVDRIRELAERARRRASGSSKDASPKEKVQWLIERGDGQGNINTDRLIVLNMGLGRDSMAMLALLADGELTAEGYKVRPQDLDAIVFSDPGMEWDHTYAALAEVDRMLDIIEQQSGVRVPFFVLSKPPMQAAEDYLATMREVWDSGVRGKSHEPYRAWRKSMENKSIEEKAAAGYYHQYAPIDMDYRGGRPNPYAVKVGDPACTDKHKVQPIRKFMEDLGKRKFGPDYKHKGEGKGSWKVKVRRGEKAPHLNLLGIAEGEGSESVGPRAVYKHPFSKENADQVEHIKSLIREYVRRTGKEPKKLQAKLKLITQYHPSELAFMEAYPLVELGITKEGESPILKRYGLDHIRKSGCVMCHSQPAEWYWVLFEKGRRGDKWAARSLQRVIDYQKASFDYINKAGKRGGVAVKSGIYQKQDPYARRSPQLGLNERRLLPEVIPLIFDLKVKPRIQAYVDEGMSEREATDQVMADIIAKDYAQGCTVVDMEGAANRLHQWSEPCWKHDHRTLA